MPQTRMPADWNWLLKTAQDEVAQTVQALPENLRAHAEGVPVSFESWPNEALLAEGWESDVLGMFAGDALDVGLGEGSPMPRQILLFLGNLWDFAEEDEKAYREEVRITYIHEFGHYLGLDEHELEERGLL